MEFGGLDEELNQIRIGAILKAPTVYFRNWQPPLHDLSPRAVSGPMTPDGNADLATARRSGEHLCPPPRTACRASPWGPVSALALTDLVMQGHSQTSLKRFTPDRFTRTLF
jgi:D-amino-acid dehydrogenase